MKYRLMDNIGVDAPKSYGYPDSQPGMGLGRGGPAYLGGWVGSHTRFANQITIVAAPSGKRSVETSTKSSDFDT